MGQPKKPNRVVGSASAVSMTIRLGILGFMIWYVSPAQLVETVGRADYSFIVGMSSFSEQYFALGLAAVAASVGLMLVLQFAHRVFPSGVTLSRLSRWVSVSDLRVSRCC